MENRNIANFGLSNQNSQQQNTEHENIMNEESKDGNYCNTSQIISQTSHYITDLANNDQIPDKLNSKLIPLDVVFFDPKKTIVFRVFNPENNQKLVVKIPTKQNYQDELKYAKEITHFDQKYFVQLQTVETLSLKGSERNVLIFESGEWSLEDILKHRKKYTQSEIAFILIDGILPGLDILAQNKLSHLDLKPANFILFSNDEKTIFFYKLSDYGSIVKFKGPNPKISCEGLGITESFTKPNLLSIINSGLGLDHINPIEHDLFCLALSILRMTGLSTEEIEKFKKKSEKESLPEWIIMEYEALIDIIMEYMLEEVRIDTHIFKTLMEVISERIPKIEQPNECSVLHEIEQMNGRFSFFKEKKNAGKDFIDKFGNLESFMLLNSLKSGFMSVPAYIKNMNNYLETGDYNKHDKLMKELMSEYQALFELQKFQEAEIVLGKLENEINKSEKGVFFLAGIKTYFLSMQMDFYDRVGNEEKASRSLKHAFYLCCSELATTYLIGNLKKYPELSEILDFLIFVFKPDHRYNGFSLPTLNNLAYYGPSTTNKINDITTRFSQCLENLSEDFADESNKGVRFFFNVTSAITLISQIGNIFRNPEHKIVKLCSFQNYLLLFDFQLLKIFDLYLENSLKKLEKIINYFVNISKFFYGSESFRDVICYRLLHKLEGADKFLEKAERIFENLMGEELSINWRVKEIKKLVNSLELFCEFENSMTEKENLMNKLQCSKTILSFLEECNKDLTSEELKKAMNDRKVKCPLIIQVLFFWDLYYENIYEAMNI